MFHAVVARVATPYGLHIRTRAGEGQACRGWLNHEELVLVEQEPYLLHEEPSFFWKQEAAPALPWRLGTVLRWFSDRGYGFLREGDGAEGKGEGGRDGKGGEEFFLHRNNLRIPLVGSENEASIVRPGCRVEFQARVGRKGSCAPRAVLLPMTAPKNLRRGTVVKWMEEGGFGFIKPDLEEPGKGKSGGKANGEEGLFVYRTSLEGDHVPAQGTDLKGRRVEYLKVLETGKPAAKRCVLLPEETTWVWKRVQAPLVSTPWYKLDKDCGSGFVKGGRDRNGDPCLVLEAATRAAYEYCLMDLPCAPYKCVKLRSVAKQPQQAPCPASSQQEGRAALSMPAFLVQPGAPPHGGAQETSAPQQDQERQLGIGRPMEALRRVDDAGREEKWTAVCPYNGLESVSDGNQEHGYLPIQAGDTVMVRIGEPANPGEPHNRFRQYRYGWLVSSQPGELQSPPAPPTAEAVPPLAPWHAPSGELLAPASPPAAGPPTTPRSVENSSLSGARLRAQEGWFPEECCVRTREHFFW